MMHPRRGVWPLKYDFGRLALDDHFVAKPRQRKSIINCAKARGYLVTTQKIGETLYVYMRGRAS